ncbi:MAG: methyltransferase domain-containing protein [Bacteroidota bacterium]
MSSKKLLSHSELDWSTTVANNAMNRERNASGPNSYAQDLGFNPIDFLADRANSGDACWVDLCCGQGKALIQTAAWFRTRPSRHQVQLEGVDLVPYFATQPSPPLQLTVSSLRDWEPAPPYDLITLVHGLHYVGDKLGVIQKCLELLSPDGLFVAHLDWANILVDGEPVTSALHKSWLQQGLEFDTRRHLLQRTGPMLFRHNLIYQGADDQAGPNFTGQPVVHSCYRTKA